jgi:hypothetical protein
MQFEPELAQPLPRRVRTREGLLYRILRVVCLLIPTAWFIGVPTYMFMREYRICHGLREWHEVPGQIVTLERQTRKNGDPVWAVRYAYSVEGIAHEHTDWLSPSEMDTHLPRLKAGDAVRVVVVPGESNLAWLHFQALERLRIADEGPRVGHLCFLFLPVVALLVWIGTYWPLFRQRQLVRYGRPTVGILTNKKETSGRSPTYTLFYRYEVPAGRDGLLTEATEGLERRMKVEWGYYKAVMLGDLLTVLYDPHRPRRSCLYRFAKYGAVVEELPGSQASDPFAGGLQ